MKLPGRESRVQQCGNHPDRAGDIRDVSARSGWRVSLTHHFMGGLRSGLFVGLPQCSPIPASNGLFEFSFKCLNLCDLRVVKSVSVASAFQLPTS